MVVLGVLVNFNGLARVALGCCDVGHFPLNPITHVILDCGTSLGSYLTRTIGI